MDSTIIDAIRRILEEAGTGDLTAVYLYGSVARGRSHVLSDVDVAVLFQAGLDAETMFERTLEIGGRLKRALGRPVDVLNLNQAPPALCFQVLRDGRLILQTDETERCLFSMRALSRYYDAKPYLDYQDARLLARIKKEGLGRGYKGHAMRLGKLDDYLRSLREMQIWIGIST